MKVEKREDIYKQRHEHLKNLSDEELKVKFWSLIEEVVDPLLELSKENTTISIERSVLLRMGFSSLEAKALVDKVVDHDLLKYGAGHVVYVCAKQNNLDIRTAGLDLINDKYWNLVLEEFRG